MFNKTHLSPQSILADLFKVASVPLIVIAYEYRGLNNAVVIAASLLLAIYFQKVFYGLKLKTAKHLDFQFSTILILSAPGFAYFFDSPTWPWWDTFTHFAVPFFLTIVLNNILFEDKLIKKLKIEPRSGQLFFLGVTALAVTILWEIAEFLIDVFADPRFRMQSDPTQSPLLDTMVDLIADVLGSAAGPLWIFLKSKMHHD